MQGAISVIPSECLKGRASVPGSGWRGDRGATHKVKEGAEFFKETSVSFEPDSIIGLVDAVLRGVTPRLKNS